MGSAIKKAVNVTVGFFKKVGEKIVDGTKKVVEVFVNGVKKVATFFKKVISFCRNGIKIVGKFFYCAGKQIIHTLTGKSGIPHLKEFFNELKKKNISMKDENNKEINPDEYWDSIAGQMNEGDTVKFKHEIIPGKKKSEVDSFKDFEENEDDPNDILGLKINDSVARVENEEMKFDDISNADTNLENY